MEPVGGHVSIGVPTFRITSSPSEIESLSESGSTAPNTCVLPATNTLLAPAPAYVRPGTNTIEASGDMTVSESKFPSSRTRVSRVDSPPSLETGALSMLLRSSEEGSSTVPPSAPHHSAPPSMVSPCWAALAAKEAAQERAGSETTVTLAVDDIITPSTLKSTTSTRGCPSVTGARRYEIGQILRSLISETSVFTHVPPCSRHVYWTLWWVPLPLFLIAAPGHSRQLFDVTHDCTSSNQRSRGVRPDAMSEGESVREMLSAP
mmetsp:Transcript_55130/g.134979  ORF Transcript_55130/g.134979 Transcript_55130/m.134979 type:complete len:262 (+) Transcript_55130:1283-2068(+)